MTKFTAPIFEKIGSVVKGFYLIFSGLKITQKMMSKKNQFKLTYLILLICGSTGVWGQNNITGKVISDANEPIIGLTILEAGTTNGTVTDVDGNYEI